jgi:phage baseplate assembly protein gpV
MREGNVLESKLKLYSLGIVVEDKKRDSSVIRVYPVEHLPLLEGDISETNEITTTVKNVAEEDVGINITEENTLYAKWLPFGHSNRVTPPDVIKNETVVIFRYADTDEFHWTTIFNEPDIRRKETVTYLFGNEPSYGEKLNKDNSHWFTVSAHDKYIQLHTSNNDGELTTYDLKIDMKAGIAELKDGKGNIIQLDSSKDTLNTNINETINVRCPEINVDSTTVTVRANKIKLDAEVTITGKTKINDDVTVSGDVNISGTMSASRCRC